MNSNITTLTIFEFQGHKLQVIEHKGEPWFIGNEVCTPLGIANSRDAISRLSPHQRDDVGITDAIGRIQNTNIISEGGLYKLAFRSRKPEAEAFTDLVADVILPSIRKTGSYGTPQQYPSTGNEFIDTLISTMPAPASYAELQRVKRFVNATEALYYPDRTVKKFEKEEKQAQKLLQEAKQSEEHLRSEVIRHMTRLAAQGHAWVTANFLTSYMKGKTRAEIEQVCIALVDLGNLQTMKTSQSIKYKLTA